MRAYEFLTESNTSTNNIEKDNVVVQSATHGKLHPWLKATLNGAIVFPDMDQYYDLYRFSILLASASSENNLVDATNVLRDHPMTVGYSQEDQDMIHQTSKKLGKDISHLTPHGSNDPPDTNIVSPVAKRKEIWDLYK